MTKREIREVCFDCGVKYGTRPKESNGTTFWTGYCDACHKEKPITSSRHYRLYEIELKD
jgi:hypothetical protein